MARKRISEDLAAQVMFDSQFKCCVCEDGSRGDQIHHIDGDSSNNEEENLVFLCLKHHGDASEKNPMRRTLSPKTIKKFKDNWNKRIRNERSNNIKELDRPIKELSEEKLLNAAISANIIIDILKIREDYFKSNWTQKVNIIDKLDKYSKFSNQRVSYEILGFLMEVSSQAKGEMTYRIAHSIYWQVIVFHHKENGDKKNVLISGLQALQIAENLIYYSTINKGDIRITTKGLNLLKFIYSTSKEIELEELNNQVLDTYTRLEKEFQDKTEDQHLLNRVYTESLNRLPFKKRLIISERTSNS